MCGSSRSGVTHLQEGEGVTHMWFIKQIKVSRVREQLRDRGQGEAVFHDCIPQLFP